MHKKLFFLFISGLFVFSGLFAQVKLGETGNEIDYSSPKDYEIAGITVSGIQYLDESALKTLSGLVVGDTIKVPGEALSKAIEKLWKQGLLMDIKIVASRIEGSQIFLDLQLKEMPRLSRFSFKGVKKGEADKLREKINLVAGKIITENVIITATNQIKDYFIEKGFLNVEARLDAIKDSVLVNSSYIIINVDKNRRTRIKHINIHGNKEMETVKIKHKLKNTKENIWWKIFTTSKFVESEYTADKQKVIDKYLEKGFRDARIVKDSVYKYNSKKINLDIWIDEGRKYYFRNISWIGNTKYSTEQLNLILDIKKGEVYNQSRLDEALSASASGRDVSSLYMDDGYLFFQVNPVEVLVEGDSIDLEMRVYEGKQARVNKVTVVGNTKTNDRVIMREIRTRPGELFSRTDVIRTQRELAQLGYFDPEKLGVTPKPNPADGTVDIEYQVEEKPSDQIELSGGWGGNQIVGTLGVSFNNFSARNFLKGETWTPLPSGDGQRLSLRVQSNGIYYTSYNASFTEPWLGGKKPNALTLSVFHSVQSNGRKKSDPGRSSITITGGSVGLGKRLTWPDDYFGLYSELNYQYYVMDNYGQAFLFPNGYSNNFFLQETFSRNSIDQPIYPRKGSQFSITVQLTPPYSLLNNKDYKYATDQEKYKFIEYHKYKFSAQTFNNIGNKLVITPRASFGYLAYYNKDIGDSPFERFYLGGSGLSGFSLDGREIIALRGYDDNSVQPPGGGTIYDKFTLEMRYPISLNPSATIYTLGFLEAGNAWNKSQDFNPFDVKRSAGFGVRIFLPMFGLLGLDYGWGFDEIPNRPGANGGQFHFIIGQQFN